MTSFAENLVAARRLAGLTQERLAGRAGLQPAAISHFETGRREPSFANLRALVDALRMPADVLVRGELPPSLPAGPALVATFWRGVCAGVAASFDGYAADIGRVCPWDWRVDGCRQIAANMRRFAAEPR